MKWLIGAHADGEQPLAEIADRDADLVQFFLSDPQGWKKPGSSNKRNGVRCFLPCHGLRRPRHKR